MCLSLNSLGCAARTFPENLLGPLETQVFRKISLRVSIMNRMTEILFFYPDEGKYSVPVKKVYLCAAHGDGSSGRLV